MNAAENPLNKDAREEPGAVLMLFAVGDRFEKNAPHEFLIKRFTRVLCEDDTSIAQAVPMLYSFVALDRRGDAV